MDFNQGRKREWTLGVGREARGLVRRFLQKERLHHYRNSNEDILEKYSQEELVI